MSALKRIEEIEKRMAAATPFDSIAKDRIVFNAHVKSDLADLCKALRLLITHVNAIEQVLTCGAAEYVPAIGDAFEIIDNAFEAINAQLTVAKDAT